MEQRVASLSCEEKLSLYMMAEELFNADRYAEAEPTFLNEKASLKARTRLTSTPWTANGVILMQSAMGHFCGELDETGMPWHRCVNLSNASMRAK